MGLVIKYDKNEFVKRANLKHNNKLIEIGTKKIFPRLNKFKLLSESPTNTQPIRDSYISGLF